MTVTLRDYQEELLAGIFNAWGAGHKSVLAVSPTGSGKAYSAATVVKRYAQPACVMVHRGELVAQLSESLADVGITHRVIASKSTVAMCVARHVKKYGRSFVHPQSPVGLASVQTLVRRTEKLSQWLSTIRLLLIDESHHAAASQYVEIASKLNDDCRILGVTATPDRCDRKSLARVQGGMFDTMVEGPTVRWLIDQGYLTPYKYYAPPPSIHMDDDDISPGTGDFKADAVRQKSHESRIVGDVVGTYQKFVAGKQAIVFTVDVETSHEVSEAFNNAGIKAAAVSGKTPDTMRNAIMAKFESKSVQIAANTALFDEGLDIKNVDCTIMARPTNSIVLFRQQIGRCLRPVYAPGMPLDTAEQRKAAIAASEKPYAIIIDHVENYLRHGLPDSERAWQLVRQDTKRSKNREDEIPLTSCTQCFVPRPRTQKTCPHCGFTPEPASRGSIEHVDGDIVELDEATLARLRGEVSRVDGAPQIPHGASEVVRRSIEKRWRERQEAQQALRHAIAVWAGMWRDKGATDSESYRRFYFTFRTDVLSCQSLGATEANELRERIEAELPQVVSHLPGVNNSVMKQEDCKTLDDWKRFAEQEGYAPMWADYMFKRTAA